SMARMQGSHGWNKSNIHALQPMRLQKIIKLPFAVYNNHMNQSKVPVYLDYSTKIRIFEGLLN
ncbi:hypothetical protein OAP59_01975, partial [Flavobacteriales bacterium]|nr:hypothetical protein [Flavobacteriales bacterium]